MVRTERPDFVLKEYRVDIAKDMLTNVSDDSTFMTSIITGDESWLYEYDVETVQQSSESLAKNERNSKNTSVGRKLKWSSFSSITVVHHEFHSIGLTVNKEYYLIVLRLLLKAIPRKWSDLWAWNLWFFIEFCVFPFRVFRILSCRMLWSIWHAMSSENISHLHYEGQVIDQSATQTC